ncbi:hypothetical protein BMF94_0175 [Rhodotorula taiwanensis]|uniref:Uncharacterized protein n=1 Tax=Rhodotorula taiwanensis TaxID=741276 RepID=A0A2S5BIH8_9BASI|nr:hypothetical protein BMF94_0175 [Rhodotorula taiwanensis]
MGAGASKQAAKVKPTRAAATAQQPLAQRMPSPAASARPQPQQPPPKASETKSDAIRRESEDPDFARNLAALGQVKVPTPGSAYMPRQDNAMLDILAERQRVDEIAEQTPAHKVRNLLSAGTLAHLFDERKACTSQKELDELSREFGMDPEIVERLAKHVNTPSISKIALPTKDANDTPKQLARWVDPPLTASEQPKLSA